MSWPHEAAVVTVQLSRQASVRNKEKGRGRRRGGGEEGRREREGKKEGRYHVLTLFASAFLNVDRRHLVGASQDILCSHPADICPPLAMEPARTWVLATNKTDDGP